MTSTPLRTSDPFFLVPEGASDIREVERILRKTRLHALRTLLTDERDGYYADFGKPEQLARAFAEGFVYQGEHSTFRERRQGVSSKDLEPSRFVVFAQNHDQVGNRMSGDRLGSKVPLDRATWRNIQERTTTGLGRVIAQILGTVEADIDAGTYFAWDPLAAMALVDPSIVRESPLALEIALRAPEEGRTRRVANGTANASVALDANAQRFHRLFLSAFAR